MTPGLSKGLRRGSSNISTPISGGTSTDDGVGINPQQSAGLSRWTKRAFSTISALQPQITAPSNEPTVICEGMVADVSHGTKRGPSTISAPQSQIKNGVSHVTKRAPPTISALQSQINNGASREKKRGSSIVSASQPQINPTPPVPTILTSVGNSINGVHKRSSRCVSAISAPQSQMPMSSKPTTPISDETSTDGAPKLFKKAREKTHLASERALHAAGSKLPVTIKVEDRRPNGANSSFFVTEIGFIVRTFAPLQYECFGNIPNQEKESLVFPLLVSSEDEDECGDDEEWMENAVQKEPRGPIKVFHKTHYNDSNDHYNDTNGWTSKLAEACYNEMIALQKEQEGLDEAKRLSEKEICVKVLGKRSACAFSFKPTTREEELEAENEQLKLELKEMKATMTSVKDM